MSANELLADVRLGTEVSFTRVFIVDSPTDASSVTVDPRFDSELLQKAAFGTSVVGLPNAIAGRPATVESLDNFIFVVEVPYETPSALNPGFGGAWQMRMSAGLETQHVVVEPQTDQEIADGLPPIVVGAFDFKKPETLIRPTALGEWDFVAGEGGRKLSMLGDPKTWNRKPEGMDIHLPAASVILTKIFSDASEARLSELAFRLSKINNDEMSLPGFRAGAFAPREAMLANFDVENIPAGNPADPPVHSISVVFAIRPGGWQNKVVHTYTDPDKIGSAAAIVLTAGTQPSGQPAGEVVSETFRRQFELPFNGWLESL